jgi:hypothetical protein
MAARVGSLLVNHNMVRDVRYNELVATNKVQKVWKDGIIVWQRTNLQWDIRDVGPGLRDVVFGSVGGTFIICSNAGTHRAWTSNDGFEWLPRSTVLNNNWEGIYYSTQQRRYVIAGVGSSSVVTTLNYGSTWTSNTVPLQNITGIVHAPSGGDGWVGVDAGGHFLSSDNGTAWSQRNGRPGTVWSDIQHGDGHFRAIARAGTTRMQQSTNGRGWSDVTIPVQPWTSLVAGMVNGQRRWVAVADNGRIMTSTTGLAWTIVPNDPGDYGWRKVKFGAGMFVAVGDNGAVMYSFDGLNWVYDPTPFPINWNGCCFGRNRFIAVGGTSIMTGEIIQDISHNPELLAQPSPANDRIRQAEMESLSLGRDIPMMSAVEEQIQLQEFGMTKLDSGLIVPEKKPIGIKWGCANVDMRTGQVGMNVNLATMAQIMNNEALNIEIDMYAPVIHRIGHGGYCYDINDELIRGNDGKAIRHIKD